MWGSINYSGNIRRGGVMDKDIELLRELKKGIFTSYGITETFGRGKDE